MSTINDTPNCTAVASRRPTYPQDWRSYNAAQVHEKAAVADLLHALCAAIDSPTQTKGRPRIPLADATFCAVMKIYAGTSGRRAMTDLREYEAKGYIDRTPHYNSVFNALENPALTPVLRTLIEESARPLRPGGHLKLYQAWPVQNVPARAL